ncbi:MAG: hypothetical protein IJ676_05780 [Clostridia bacterium]|nr:hypothetical protein [Clostridia bacterium]
MFKDIGKKIKVVAKVCTWIGIIGGAICGIVLLALDIIIAGIIVLIVAPIISWLSMFTLYGFGQLIDNSDIIVNLLSQPAQQIEQENVKKKIKDSSIEDDEYINIACPQCHNSLSYHKYEFFQVDTLVCPYCSNEIQTKKFK